MKHLAFLLVLLGALVSCKVGWDNPEAGSSDCATHTRHLRMYGDPAFTEAERVELITAGHDFDVWTSGRARVDVLFGRNTVGQVAHVWKVGKNSPLVLAHEAKEAERRHVPVYNVLGWQEDEPPAVFLVVDRIREDPANNLELLAAHEFAHALNFRWSNCEDNPRAPRIAGTDDPDCSHVRETGALMSQTAARVPFAAPDRELCRSSCLCD